MGIIVLGSTGSIGVQTLDCIENLGLSVSAMCAGRNFTLFEKQIRKFMPQAVAMSDEDAANKLKDMISDLHIPVPLFIHVILNSAKDPVPGVILSSAKDLSVRN